MTVREWLLKFIDKSPLHKGVVPTEIVDRMGLKNPILLQMIDNPISEGGYYFDTLANFISEAAGELREEKEGAVFGDNPPGEQTFFDPDNPPPEVEEVELEFPPDDNEFGLLNLYPPPDGSAPQLVKVAGGFLSTVNDANIPELVAAFKEELKQNLEIKPILARQPGLLNECDRIEVRNCADQTAATALYLDASKMVKTIEDIMDPVRAKAFEFHKAITGLKTDLTNHLRVARDATKIKIERYDLAQKAEAIKLKYAARAKAIEEQKKVQVALEKKAAEAREKGKEERALFHESQAENVPLFIPSAPEVPKIQGATFAVDSKVTVIEGQEMKVLQAIINGHLPIGCVTFKVGSIKTRLKDDKIPAATALTWGILLEKKSTMRGKG